jgi:hypothetical protein
MVTPHTLKDCLLCRRREEAALAASVLWGAARSHMDGQELKALFDAGFAALQEALQHDEPSSGRAPVNLEAAIAAYQVQLS